MVEIKKLHNYCEDKTIIFVGNSRVLLDKQNGDFIDSHDIVLRFNGGYSSASLKKYIGEKTDIWSVAMRVPVRLSLCHKLFKGRKYTIWPSYHKWIFTSPSASPFLKQVESTLLKIPIKHYFKVYVKYQEDKYISEKELIELSVKDMPLPGIKPTSGSVLLHYFTKYIKYKTINLIGFDFLKEKKHFYKDYNVDCLIESPHEQAKEEMVMQNLINNSENVKLVN